MRDVNLHVISADYWMDDGRAQVGSTEAAAAYEQLVNLANVTAEQEPPFGTRVTVVTKV